MNNCLFETVELPKNADPDKYKYSSYRIGFDSRSEFLFTDGSMEKYVIIYGTDMSSSVHVDNKNRDNVILGKGAAQRLNDTKLTVEDKYPFNFTQRNKRLLLSLHYNLINSFLFVNATKMYKFSAKNSEMKDYTVCLGNIFTILQFLQLII